MYRLTDFVHLVVDILVLGIVTLSEIDATVPLETVVVILSITVIPSTLSAILATFFHSLCLSPCYSQYPILLILACQTRCYSCLQSDL